MIWLRFAPYIVTLLAVGGAALWLNNAAYDRGREAANKVCTDETVPAAVAENQARCNILMQTTKEENDAALSDLNRLRATYDRLRKAKPIRATCLPLAAPSGGNARANGEAKPIGGVGVNTEWLDDAFYDASRDIAKGESCQRQMKRVYQLNNALPSAGE